MSGESFWTAKPVKSHNADSVAGATDLNGQLDDSLTMAQVQKLLYEVQSVQEDAVRRQGELVDEFIDAETAWKAHQARVLIFIRDRLAKQDPKAKERTSEDLREAEVLTERDEEGRSGKALYRAYRLSEERVKQADRYCKTLERRGSLLQTLASNMRGVT